MPKKKKRNRHLKILKSVTPGKLENGDTIYLTTSDQEGNMVSLIQSNYRGMGSGMVPPGLGFMLQDRGELFLWKKDTLMFMSLKRDLFILLYLPFNKDGSPWVSFGLMGGLCSHKVTLKL